MHENVCSGPTFLLEVIYVEPFLLLLTDEFTILCTFEGQ